MPQEKIFTMPFSKVYPLLIQKAQKKNRSKEEVDEITCWLTGYSKKDINTFLNSEIAYGDFFTKAPQLNPKRKLIKGTICKVRVESIEDPLMQNIRYLDKLIDDLSKGKALKKILMKEE